MNQLFIVLIGPNTLKYFENASTMTANFWGSQLISKYAFSLNMGIIGLSWSLLHYLRHGAYFGLKCLDRSSQKRIFIQQWRQNEWLDRFTCIEVMLTPALSLSLSPNTSTLWKREYMKNNKKKREILENSKSKAALDTLKVTLRPIVIYAAQAIIVWCLHGKFERD